MATIKTIEKFYDYVLSIDQNLQSLLKILNQNKIVISFNALSADTNPSPIHTFKGQSIGILPKISIPGYDLDGWYANYTKDPNSGVQTWVDQVHDNDKITFTRNTTLYAKWKNRRVQITLDAGDGSCNYDAIYVPYLSYYGNWIDTPTGTVLSERRNLPTCVAPASTFLNWKNSAGTVINKDDQMCLSDDFTLYANYEVQKYTLTYNLNGGSLYSGRENEFTASERITYNTINHQLKQYGNNPPMYKTGYIFRGWVMSKNDVNVLNTITIFYNTKVFAYWEPIQYTLKYGNANNAITVRLKYNEVYDLLPFSEVISYSEFKCWKYIADSKTNYLLDEQLVCNLTTTNNATVTLLPQNTDPPINSAIRVFLIPARKVIIDTLDKLQRDMAEPMYISSDNENPSSVDVIYDVDSNIISQSSERPVPELSAFFNPGDAFTLDGQFELSVEVTNQAGEITTEILPEEMFTPTIPFGTILENKYPYIIYDDIQLQINILNSIGVVDLRVVILPEFQLRSISCENSNNEYYIFDKYHLETLSVFGLYTNGLESNNIYYRSYIGQVPIDWFDFIPTKYINNTFSPFDVGEKSFKLTLHDDISINTTGTFIVKNKFIELDSFRINNKSSEILPKYGNIGVDVDYSNFEFIAKFKIFNANNPESTVEYHVLSSDISAENINLNDFDSLTNKAIITFSYDYNGIKKSDEYEIDVDIFTPDNELLSIEILSAPIKNAYSLGQIFDPTGLIVNAIFMAGSKELELSDLHFTKTEDITIHTSEQVLSNKWIKYKKYNDTDISTDISIDIDIDGEINPQIITYEELTQEEYDYIINQEIINYDNSPLNPDYEYILSTYYISLGNDILSTNIIVNENPLSISYTNNDITKTTTLQIESLDDIARINIINPLSQTAYAYNTNINANGFAFNVIRQSGLTETLTVNGLERPDNIDGDITETELDGPITNSDEWLRQLHGARAIFSRINPNEYNEQCTIGFYPYNTRLFDSSINETILSVVYYDGITKENSIIEINLNVEQIPDDFTKVLTILADIPNDNDGYYLMFNNKPDQLTKIEIGDKEKYVTVNTTGDIRIFMKFHDAGETVINVYSNISNTYSFIFGINYWSAGFNEFKLDNEQKYITAIEFNENANIDFAEDSAVFCYCQNITHLEIPKSVKTIPLHTFFYCLNLESVKFLGRTKTEIQAIPNYPWDLSPTIIQDKNGSYLETRTMRKHKKVNN